MSFDQLVEAARAGRPLIRAVVFAGLAFVTVLGSQGVVILISRTLSVGPVAGVLPFAALIGLTWLFTRYVDRRPFPSIGLWSRDFAWHWWRGFVIGLAMFATTAAIPALFGAVHVAGLASGSQLLIPLLGFLFFLIQGPAEELVTRGYLLPTTAAGSNLPVAVILTSAYFAFAHSLNPHVTPLGIVNLFLAGVFLALYFIAEGNLWGVFGWHTAWNWAEGPLLGLPVSGIEVPFPVLDLDTAGLFWLTGGAFGPEGGLAATVVLGAGCGFLLWRGRKH